VIFGDKMNKSRIPKLTDIMAIVPAHVYGTGTVNAGRIYSGKRAVVLVLNEEYEEEREQTMTVRSA